MAVIKSYQQGSPSWVDLATNDGDGAKKFYTRLFGWEVEDVPMGEGEFYTMYKHQGEHVAASFQDNQSGAPPRWQIYFAVDDVDASAKKAHELGAKILLEPSDVFDAGRMSVVQDPQGAVFMLWQAKEHKGAGRLDETGAVTWFELITTDAAAATDFYTKLLGLTSERAPVEPGYPEYYMLNVGGASRAGVMKQPDNMSGMPSYWGVYFGVPDLDKGLAVVADMGGKKLLTEPIDIPDGKIIPVQDPQGATFSLHEPNQE